MVPCDRTNCSTPSFIVTRADPPNRAVGRGVTLSITDVVLVSCVARVCGLFATNCESDPSRPVVRRARVDSS